MTFDELVKLAVKVKDKKGAAVAKSAIQKYAPKLQNVAESDYDKLADELREILSPSKVDKEEKVLTYKDIREQALAVKRTFGVGVLLECIKKVCGEDATSMGQIMESQYAEFVRVTKERLTVHGVGIKHYMPGDEIKTLHPEPDNTADQVESLSRKTQMPPAIAAPYGKHALQVNRTIETREDAIAAVKELQEKWDLIDDVKVAETLMGKMEERHGEEFNAFFEASVRQVMLAAGLQQVKINTSDILLTLATGTQMRVREEPGFLIYEMVEDNDA